YHLTYCFFLTGYFRNPHVWFLYPVFKGLCPHLRDNFYILATQPVIVNNFFDFFQKKIVTAHMSN
ncbi:hypothetical protein ACMZ5S_06405, partial [Streptococcus pluranimalium]